MSIEWLIYLADVVGALSAMLIIGGLVCAFLSGGLVVYLVDNMDKHWYVGGICFLISLSSIVFGVLLPSKQAIYLIAGASIAKDLAKTETMKKVETTIESELDKLIHRGEKK